MHFLLLFFFTACCVAFKVKIMVFSLQEQREGRECFVYSFFYSILAFLKEALLFYGVEVKEDVVISLY